MSEHTPGPWIVVNDRKNLADGRFEVAYLAPYHTVTADTLPAGTGIADATLIAAAPDMFAALTEPCSLSNNGTFADDLEALANFLVELQFGATSRDLRHKAQQIRAAIAKATANQPITQE